MQETWVNTLLEWARGDAATAVSRLQEDAFKNFGAIMRYVRAIAGHAIFRTVEDRRA